MTLKGMGIGTGIVIIGILIPNLSTTDNAIGLSLFLTLAGVIYWFHSFE